MTYSITTKDGITVRNIPDAIPPDSIELKAKVEAIRRGEIKGRAQSSADLIPTGLDATGKQILAGDLPVTQPTPEPGLIDKAVGAGEAALTTGTGVVGGTLGMIGGTLKGLAEQILAGNFGTPQAANLVEQAAASGARALTYEPRTAEGQRMVEENVAPVAQALLPLAGLAPQLGMVGELSAPARNVAGAAVARAVQRVETMAEGVSTLPRRAMEAVRKSETPTPGTYGSVGAAGTDMATQRVALASELPVPIRLTKGQATRDPAQLKFETETSKLPEQGTALRQRIVEQNQGILNNFDAWIDQTGAQAPTLRAAGMAVDSALMKQAAADKAAIRAAYKAAEQAGEMEAPLTLDSVVQHLNESAPDTATAPLLDVARRRALQLGLAVEQDGQLVPQAVPLKIAETFRQAISRATDFEPTNVRQSTILRGLVDEATAGKGGDLYRSARATRQRFAQNYEDRAVIAKLVNNKRGSADRQVAFEDVFDHSILKGSLDDVRNVRRVLHRSGPEGEQAWRELQGQTATWIRDQTFGNVATDAAGNRVASAAAMDKAIRALDVDGRLDFIFGKKGAQQMRDLRDLAQYVKTVPPEAGANTSNTAATLLTAFADITFSGLTGTPAPITTATRLAARSIKDRNLRKRIEDALNGPEKQAPGRTKPVPKTEPDRTIH